ncbi:alpha-beta hydrolase superfamily lysophospholipase [Microbacteriaceae bacterium SG_E_30_P1]|uniref:Alpha-beta hydrolase superfamily lysophospholipase n=1 Tax=Antiquaquibacter oligotrophicus TaxID=2880260 RepID=A0ABT6KL98_9MICO|nr:alpha/beta hydrolase [Antiquaquibacter oligotrophicus]MDH6180778.1 alpha-beta hydrolase superfamily lysophospholipase [Antiquaquibacter oligotrophicus]UDF13503.1 alpha/beta hydrolase [Antiquaquibacter oligotrophicus]
MTDCLAATGADVLSPVVFIVSLAVLAIGAVLVLRRYGSRPGREYGAALLVLALVVVGAATTGQAPTTATAAEECATIQKDANVTFVSGDVTFHASYRAPVDPTRPVAAAVIVGGTGAVDRDGNGAGIRMEQYAWLADLLASQGIASLRYDKLGTGETGLGPYADDPSLLLSRDYNELRVQPVRDALSFLAAKPGIDPARLLLIGHSEGGAVTITVAGSPGSGPTPAGLLLIEPSYDRILNVVPRQLAEQIDAAVAGSAMTEADAGVLKSWMADGVNEIRTGTPPFPAPGPVPLPGATDYTAVMQSTIANNIYGSDPTQMVVSHAYRTLYGQRFDEIDAATVAPSITVPVLVTCGTKDFNTPCGDGSPGSGVAYLATQFAPGVARFVELTNVVHILRDVGAADVPSLADQVAYPFSTQLEHEVTAFVAPFSR